MEIVWLSGRHQGTYGFGYSAGTMIHTISSDNLANNEIAGFGGTNNHQHPTRPCSAWWEYCSDFRLRKTWKLANTKMRLNSHIMFDLFGQIARRTTKCVRVLWWIDYKNGSCVSGRMNKRRGGLKFWRIWTTHLCPCRMDRNITNLPKSSRKNLRPCIRK